jgi:hypothetical protein
MFRRKHESPRWTRASAGTSSVMVSFGKTGTGSLGTAPAESDDRRAATVKRWVAGGEEVGSSADRHPRAQKKENRRAGSPAGTAALNRGNRPSKEAADKLAPGLQPRARRVQNTLASPKSLFGIITFWTGECWGTLWIFLLDRVLRAPLRVKDLPSTLPLDGFLPAADPTGGR